MSKDEAAIKNTLDFILRNTFEDSENYTKYFVSIVPKELKKRHGLYNPKEAKIVINNLSREHEHTLITCLHELTHHVQYQKEGETNHEETFFSLFHKLCCTALSYGYLKPKHFRELEDSYDYDYLSELYGSVEDWDYSLKKFEGKIIFSIKTEKQFKRYLELKGFQWYTLSQTWQKVYENRESAAKEWKELVQKIPREHIQTKNEGKVEFLAYYYLGVLNGYDYRQKLESLGFIWEGYGTDKMWVKKVPAQEYYAYLRETLTEFSGVEYKKVTPDLKKEKRRIEKLKKVTQKKQKKIILPDL